MTVDKKLKYYAKKLNQDAPEGEFLAYINKKESNLLKRKGGLGIKTRSGIPSYIGSDASGQGGGASGGGPGDASDSDSGGGKGGGNGGSTNREERNYVSWVGSKRNHCRYRWYLKIKAQIEVQLVHFLHMV